MLGRALIDVKLWHSLVSTGAVGANGAGIIGHFSLQVVIRAVSESFTLVDVLVQGVVAVEVASLVGVHVGNVHLGRIVLDCVKYALVRCILSINRRLHFLEVSIDLALLLFPSHRKVDVHVTAVAAADDEEADDEAEVDVKLQDNLESEAVVVEVVDDLLPGGGEDD